MGGAVNSHPSPQAENTAAILQQASHGGLSVLIPGALEPCGGHPTARPANATAYLEAPRAPAAAVNDRERLEHEREGGGAPSERTGGKPSAILARLWQATLNTLRS